jgi:elongation factor P
MAKHDHLVHSARSWRLVGKNCNPFVSRRDSLNRLQVNLLEGMDVSCARMGKRWPDSRQIALNKPGKIGPLRPEAFLREWRQNAGIDGQNQYVAARNRPIWPLGHDVRIGRGQKFRKTALKVIASSIRKGNIIEQDGKLYVVLSAENIHPGKGTPVSQIEMRRIGDGVKVSERYKTTDQVEKATVEDRNFNYLYEDADGFHFMNNETYDQVQVSKEIVGSSAPYLQENMTVKLSMHDMNPVAIQLPQRATLEVVETEPVTKGQTASSSYKPAILSNGVRTAVPPHIGTGTRIVVMTEDGSYVERAKD